MTAMLAAALLAGGREAAAQKPLPANSRFQLSRAGNWVETHFNRVRYGIRVTGEFGPPENADNVVSGNWPAPARNQYMYNSGAQMAGIIAGPKSATNPWGGDTTGAFIFDMKGTTEHGTPLTSLLDAGNPTDLANWPDEARVPGSGPSAALYHERYRGAPSASPGDLWFFGWEGDPKLLTGRTHPLGVAVETRVLGWPYPVGNEDVFYVAYTFYNITSTSAADYAAYPVATRTRLLGVAQQFQALNNAKFGITLPTGGYTIASFHAGMGADPDVNPASVNFTTVNMPLAMGFAYAADFGKPGSWTFDQSLHSPPFFYGSGFVGIKVLSAFGQGPKLRMFSQMTGSGAFPDASNVFRLYRYLSATADATLGVVCNHGDFAVVGICYILSGSPADVRFTEGIGPTQLAPGGSATMVVAYVHAAPYAAPGYPFGGVRVQHGDALRWRNAASMAQGANLIDSIAGFTGFADANGDGAVQPSEIAAAPRSLYGKAKVAQAIFDAKFLLPVAPDAPDFFVIPGDRRVTVVWKPSATETVGDPYFDVARDPTMTPSGGGAPVPNPLYDPDFRKFDVEGYRVYRGRTDDRGAMTMLAQFDYAGTSFDDYNGQVPIYPDCAPELNVTTSCANVFDPVVDGVARTKKRSYDIAGVLPQVRYGQRSALTPGNVVTFAVDSLPLDARALVNSGVPFAFIDSTVTNNSAYYYVVTAFDVNSVQSGPMIMESDGRAKRAMPRSMGSNVISTATIESGLYGRRGRLTDTEMPTLDSTTGRFSKRFPPANGVELSLLSFAKEVVGTSGEVSFTLDSIVLGTQVEAQTQNVTEHFTFRGPRGATRVALPLAYSLTTATVETSATLVGVPADPVLAARYGGSPDYAVPALYRVRTTAGYYAAAKARGCINSAAGFAIGQCFYNGPRWFVGDVETVDHPNGANTGGTQTGIVTSNFNNAGALPPGVRTLHHPMAYNDRGSTNWRSIEAALSPFVGAADYRVYWGFNGAVDSVIDLTHDVPVPFDPRMGASWGFLNATAVPAAQSYDARAALTASDFMCVEPLKSLAVAQVVFTCSGTAVPLSPTAAIGPVVFDHTGTEPTVDRTAPQAPNGGFGLYIKGELFIVEMTGSLPVAGSQWTMRDYIGAVSGGIGAAGVGASGNFGPYRFSSGSTVRQLSAVGVAAKVKFTVANEVLGATRESLARVHTIPDPYYVNRDELDTPIRFVNLPDKATVRIYTSRGILVRVLKHESPTLGGDLTWDARTRENKYVASGVYFYHVTADNGAASVGRMTIVKYVR